MKIRGRKVFLIIILFLIQFTVYAQIDSLNRDTIELGRVYINKNDTAGRFVPLDSINYSDFNPSFLIKKKKHPGRAALYSFLLPGLGQAYNEKYWKIPIIYGLFAGMYFLYDSNNFKHNLFKTAYKNYSDVDGVTTPGVNPALSKDRLKTQKDYYQRQRDFNVIIGVVVYLFNILDANVDAHLMDFDVGDDLSLRVTPDINNYSSMQFNSNRKFENGNTFGLKFVLAIHK